MLSENLNIEKHGAVILPPVSYLVSTKMEEHTRKVFDNKELRRMCVPDRRDDVRGNFKHVYCESTIGNGLI
jgi:hypothetical protein